MLVCSTK